MTLEEFRSICIARYGFGWQSKLARTLNVNPRTVRRWAAGDAPVPLAVQIQLGAQPSTAREYPDEWLVARNYGGGCKYAIHLASPRFIGMIVSPQEMGPGVCLALRDEVVAHITWIDPPPNDLQPLRCGLQATLDTRSL